MSFRQPSPRSLLSRLGAECCTAALLLFSALSCESAKINMDGLACDAAGLCASGYECWQGSCVAIGSARIVDAVEHSTPEESTLTDSASNSDSTSEENAPDDSESAGVSGQTSEPSSASSASEPGSSTAEVTEASIGDDTELETSFTEASIGDTELETGFSDVALVPEPSGDATSGTDKQTERAGCLDAGASDSGVCAETCSPPLLLCGTSCVDPQVNPLHCGQCNLLCEAPRLGSAACVAGTCQQLCVEGSLVCDGRCTDVTSRRQDCGACGNRCPNGMKCVDGRCQ